MYRNFMAIFGIVAAGCVMWALYHQWAEYQKGERQYKIAREEQAANPPPDMEALYPLASQIETELDAAEKQGAEGIKTFLDLYGNSNKLPDPRKALIQLEYVRLISFHDIAEAKRVFFEVKARIKPNSPAYEEFKKLQPNFD